LTRQWLGQGMPSWCGYDRFDSAVISGPGPGCQFGQPAVGPSVDAALTVKVQDEGLVHTKAVHIALGVHADGTKEIFGLWLEQNEGAKFWLRVMNELKNRGVEGVLIAVVEGLKGFPEAIR
jgi:hypothetical protein